MRDFPETIHKHRKNRELNTRVPHQYLLFLFLVIRVFKPLVDLRP